MSCVRRTIEPGEFFSMRYSFTDEQRDFRSMLQKFLGARSPSSEVRKLMETDSGFDRANWQKLNEELGLTAVHIPEAYGGQGFGFVELCIVLEEMGRTLLCAPYFSSVVLAATAILNAGTESQKQALLPGLASGETTATLAFVEQDGRWDATSVAMTAAGSGDRYRLSGTKSYVVDGCTADLIVVLARAPGSGGSGGLSLFTVRGDARGLTRTPLKAMDATRKLARLTFDNVEAAPLGALGAAAQPFARIMALAAVCLSNEMVGGAERLRETSLDYAKMRMQFGKAIASFQSMKHKQADMLIDVELAKSAAYYAAAAADDDAEDLAMVASLAKACASDAYLQTAIHAIQIRGGIGFTWDEDTHLWFKRAKSSEIMLGDATYHRELMMQHLAS